MWADIVFSWCYCENRFLVHTICLFLIFCTFIDWTIGIIFMFTRCLTNCLVRLYMSCFLLAFYTFCYQGLVSAIPSIWLKFSLKLMNSPEIAEYALVSCIFHSFFDFQNRNLWYSCIAMLFGKYRYFTFLVIMDMSHHSIEVVNRLTTSLELHTEFEHVHIYFMSSWESIKVFLLLP